MIIRAPPLRPEWRVGLPPDQGERVTRGLAVSLKWKMYQEKRWETARRVWALVARESGVHSVTSLSQRIGRSMSTTSWYIGEMVKKGEVWTERFREKPGNRGASYRIHHLSPEVHSAQVAQELRGRPREGDKTRLEDKASGR